MKIDKLTLYRVPLTSIETYYMSAGKSCDTVDMMVLCISTNEDLDGWGEVCPIPQYLPAYAGGVESAIDEMSSVLLGADPIGPEALMHKLDIHLQGHEYSKSIVDTALWDLTAKSAGMPLYKLLGGCNSVKLPLYHSITCIEPAKMAAIAEQAELSGITQFQVKLGADNNWRSDVERLEAVRSCVDTSALVYGDWNCGATQLDATRVGNAVAHLDVMLEQPCKTITECANVKRACGLPMKLDESAHDIASLLQAYNEGCMDAVAMKLSKFGGLSRMKRARDLCLHLGARMCIEDTWGSDISTATAIHLASSTPTDAVLNVCDLSSYVTPRLDETGPKRKDGFIRVDHKPGHGVTPNPDVLGRPVRTWS